MVGGKSRIAGHWIPVSDIVIWHDRKGESADEIATEYDLSLSDIHAALAYYFDHRSEIDQTINDGKEFLEVLRKATPSKLASKLNHNRAA